MDGGSLASFLTFFGSGLSLIERSLVLAGSGSLPQRSAIIQYDPDGVAKESESTHSRSGGPLSRRERARVVNRDPEALTLVRSALSARRRRVAPIAVPSSKRPLSTQELSEAATLEMNPGLIQANRLCDVKKTVMFSRRRHEPIAGVAEGSEANQDHGPG